MLYVRLLDFVDGKYYMLNLNVNVVLRPGKSQVTTVGILPNKCSQLARYCLVWGIHPVYGPATVGQVTIKVFYRLRPDPPCIFFSFLMFKYDVQVTN